jgi:hypothetical protein
MMAPPRSAPLVVPAHGRLDFGELQQRARRRGRSATQAWTEFPAHQIVFDVAGVAGPGPGHGYDTRGAAPDHPDLTAAHG